MSPKAPRPDQNQGTFVPNPADLLRGEISEPSPGKESEGVFLANTQVTAEQRLKYDRLDHEKKALDQLAIENESRGHVDINQGKLSQEPNPYTPNPEDETPDVKQLKAAIKKSRQSKEEGWIWSQLYFAKSIGIDARLETRDKIGKDGEPIRRPGETYTVKEPVINTVNPDEQHTFDSAYADFRHTYFGTDNKPVLDARRSAIARELSSMASPQSTAPDPSFLARVKQILPPKP